MDCRNTTETSINMDKWVCQISRDFSVFAFDNVDVIFAIISDGFEKVTFMMLFTLFLGQLFLVAMFDT